MSFFTDPFGSIAGTINDIGQGVSDALAGVDQTVRSIIPGGWATVTAAALIAVGIYDPELLSSAEEGTLTSDQLANAGLDPTVVANNVADAATVVTPADAVVSTVTPAATTTATEVATTTAGATSAADAATIAADTGVPEVYGTTTYYPDGSTLVSDPSGVQTIYNSAGQVWDPTSGVNAALSGDAGTALITNSAGTTAAAAAAPTLLDQGAAWFASLTPTQQAAAIAAGVVAAPPVINTVGKVVNSVVNTVTGGGGGSTPVVPDSTTTYPTLTQATAALPPLYSTSPENMPGATAVTPFYKTSSPVQSQYYWGRDQASAPATPWGLQSTGQPFDVNSFISNLVGPNAQKAYQATIPPTASAVAYSSMAPEVADLYGKAKSTGDYTALNSYLSTHGLTSTDLHSMFPTFDTTGALSSTPGIKISPPGTVTPPAVTTPVVPATTTKTTTPVVPATTKPTVANAVPDGKGNIVYTYSDGTKQTVPGAPPGSVFTYGSTTYYVAPDGTVTTGAAPGTTKPSTGSVTDQLAAAWTKGDIATINSIVKANNIDQAALQKLYPTMTADNLKEFVNSGVNLVGATPSNINPTVATQLQAAWSVNDVTRVNNLIASNKISQAQLATMFPTMKPADFTTLTKAGVTFTPAAANTASTTTTTTSVVPTVADQLSTAWAKKDVATVNQLLSTNNIDQTALQKLFPTMSADDLKTLSDAGVKVATPTPASVTVTSPLQDSITKAWAANDVATLNTLIANNNLNAADIQKMYPGVDLSKVTAAGVNLPGAVAPAPVMQATPLNASAVTGPAVPTTNTNPTQDAVNQWFVANPTATTDQVISTIKQAGGLTPDLTAALASHYGSTTDAVTQAYNASTAAPVASAPELPPDAVASSSVAPPPAYTPPAYTPPAYTPPPPPETPPAAVAPVAPQTYNGISASDISNFVQQNIGNPAAVAAAAQQYGLSANDLAAATGYQIDQVNSYLASAAPADNGASSGASYGD